MRFLLVLLDYFYSIATNSFDTFDEKNRNFKKSSLHIPTSKP